LLLRFWERDVAVLLHTVPEHLDEAELLPAGELGEPQRVAGRNRLCRQHSSPCLHCLRRIQAYLLPPVRACRCLSRSPGAFTADREIPWPSYLRRFKTGGLPWCGASTKSIGSGMGSRLGMNPTGRGIEAFLARRPHGGSVVCCDILLTRSLCAVWSTITGLCNRAW